MAKSNSKRKTRSDKFPLTLHKTGQFCKKIKGKLYYFGTDKKAAFERYLEQAAYLHAGKGFKPKSNDNFSLKTLCNLYLDYQESRSEIGEIKPRQVCDQTSHLRDFVRFIGPNRLASNITTIDLQNYRKKLIKVGKAPNTINNHISSFKAMYNWATNNEIIETVPNLKAIKKITQSKTKRAVFTVGQIQKLLDCADTQIRAMIWLGLNCGFGCTDCAELLWEHVDLTTGRVNFARKKTGVDRNLPLWKETINCLEAVPKINEHIFNTRFGNKWVRVERKQGKDGIIKWRSYDAISASFSKLLKKANIKTEKGVGFYTLRRTAATLAAKSGDPFAVQRLLGHADLKMATTYVQDISEQTDRVINNSRKLIIQDDS
ncbi:tyrosine-type recombinase/integrase [Planctomycetota bacterium]